tara:strand:- start:5184 stop:5783 length:600 start_codon:yes stop_codon:yes gene_type:complete
MGLKELAAFANSRPELHRHSAGQPFHVNFPVIKEKVSFGEEFDEQLIFIIRGRGDTQRHKTNVKADMTDWFMQKQHKQFQEVGDKAIEIAIKNSPYDMEMELFDCWGVIYQKDDWTKAHDHWPHPWSFVYYIRCGEKDAPLQFPDADLSVYPSSGEIVLFPGWVRHAVPPQDHDSERIIVAGNISPVLLPLAHPFRRFD